MYSKCLVVLTIFDVEGSLLKCIFLKCISSPEHILV